MSRGNLITGRGNLFGSRAGRGNVSGRGHISQPAQKQPVMGNGVSHRGRGNIIHSPSRGRGNLIGGRGNLSQALPRGVTHANGGGGRGNLAQSPSRGAKVSGRGNLIGVGRAAKPSSPQSNGGRGGTAMAHARGGRGGIDSNDSAPRGGMHFDRSSKNLCTRSASEGPCVLLKRFHLFLFSILIVG